MSLHNELLIEARAHKQNHPGKFEGESQATVYFYGLAMNGFTDESGDDWDAFKISDEARRDLGLSEEWFVIEESEQGFVSGCEADQETIDRLQSEDAANYTDSE